MDGVLAASMNLILFLAGLGIVLIIWYFWWQHTQAYGYGDGYYVDEVHHHYHDEDDEYDDEDDDYAPPRRGASSGRRATVDFDALRVGTSLDIHNYPERGDKTRFKAAQRNRYVLEGGRYTWYEFKLQGPDEPTWLEWEYDDQLIVTQWADEEIPLTKLDTSVDALQEISRNQSGSIRYDGVRYNFVNDCRATCYENDGSEGAEFQGWTFEADDEERLLSVMLWEGSDRHASGRVGWYLDPDEVEVA